MKHNFPYLRDTAFLAKLDRIKVREEYVKIISLDFNENPLEEIQGKVISGSVNIAGGSALRRTCSFDMYVDEEYSDKILSTNTSFALNKKIDMLKGIKNVFKDSGEYSDYDIIWFPLGIYVMCGLSLSHDADGGVSISIQGKDKMCLLNGDVGGQLPASVIFSEYEVEDSYAVTLDNTKSLDGDYNGLMESTKTLRIGDDAVKLEEDGYYSLLLDGAATLEYKSSIFTPTIFMIIQELVNHFGGEDLSKIVISDVPLKAKMVMRWTGDVILYGYIQNGTNYIYTLNETIYNQAIAIEGNVSIPNENPGGEDGKFTNGDNVGYIYTDFIYPGELSGNAGDSVTFILDQIIKHIGNFEYFYDVDGVFHFQEKKNYLNTTQAKIELQNMQASDYEVNMSKGKSVYNFDDSMIVNSFNSNPQYDMIKNDFIVWGTRKGTDKQELPIRYHLAIDTKPETGNTYDCIFYQDATDKLLKVKAPIVFPTRADFPKEGTVGLLYEALNGGQPEDKVVYYWSVALQDYQVVEDAIPQEITTKDWRTELYLSGSQTENYGLNSNYYYAELKAEWPKLYDVLTQQWYKKNKTDLDYFLDFIDSSAAISEFSVSNIGRRQKIVTDSDVNCLFEPVIPDIVMIKQGEGSQKETEECIKEGQNFSLVPSSIYDYLASGYNYYSAYSLVRDLLYQYTNYNETISLSTLPVYYLDTNVRITVKDIESGIDGDYMVDSISIPLDSSSLMSINATKAWEKL